MNLDSQKKAIAEACGVKPTLVEWWAHKPDVTGGSICMSARTKREVEEWIDRNPEYAKGYSPKAFYQYPDYPGDLNAIHRAINSLPEHEIAAILMEACEIAKRDGTYPILSSAAQLSEALLRAFGLWTESPPERSDNTSP